MTKNEISAIWRSAATIDPSLAIRASDFPRVLKKQISREPYTRARLFECLSKSRPIIFEDFRVRLFNRNGAPYESGIFALLEGALPAKRRISAGIGPLQECATVQVGEVLRRWRRGDKVAVTDLHFRGTRLENLIDLDALSDFNLLLLGSEKLSLQEMMTLVISSAGSFTDSHSDDPDGSNHCFTGEKLWLAWDTFDGRAAGLEDTSRDIVVEKAAFDFRTFMSLESSRWFIVSDGDTLFLPGSLTHKVITLRKYIGLGSFFVSFAGGIQTMRRWYEHRPLWERGSPANRGLLDEIARIMRRKAQSLSGTGAEMQERWGYSFLEADSNGFEKGCSPTTVIAGDAQRRRGRGVA